MFKVFFNHSEEFEEFLSCTLQNHCSRIGPSYEIRGDKCVVGDCNKTNQRGENPWKIPGIDAEKSLENPGKLCSFFVGHPAYDSCCIGAEPYDTCCIGAEPYDTCCRI